MRILFSLIDFREIGGAQMYFYELSRALMKRGHTCTIISNIDGFMASLSQLSGIRCIPYRLLQDLSAHDFDIIHASHIPNLKDIIHNNILPEKPLVTTCHSEIIPVEFPFVHDRIQAYIAIRETIADKMRYAQIPGEKIHLIYNPIDDSRYNINYGNDPEQKVISFVGSIDNLRKQALEFCYKHYVQEQGYKMYVVGRVDFVELVGNMPEVEFVGARLDVEEFIKKSSFVAGIQDGRTKWEAALCGKPYLNFWVNEIGEIIAYDERPKYQKDDEVLKYSSAFVARQIEGLYEDVLK